jgi:anthranilate synthase/aminodeoxychorismate synthase-like glutamine amidotransferase
MNILVVDNYDSFTYNLLESFKLEGCDLDVVYNSVNPESISIENYDLLLLSPGPSTPKNAGFLMDYIKRFKYEIPILGVCLGFQALVESFGGSLGFLDAPVHGKISEIVTDSGVLFNYKGVQNVGRYHSIFAKEVTDDFKITARTKSGLPMAIEHVKLPIYGVQFHPESILSMAENVGKTLITNLLNQVRDQNVQNIA